MKKLNVLLGLAALMSAIPAYATLIDVSQGVGVLAFPPASVQPGKLTSSQFVFLFLEKQSVTLLVPLTVDISTAGTFTAKPTTTTTIPAGTVVNSYYVHANVPSGKVVFNTELIGFSSEETVIGLMVNWPTIQAADGILGLTSTMYDTTDKGIGLHFPPAAKDSMMLGPLAPATNNTQITFTEGVSTKSITDFRIVTTITPGH